MSLFVNSNNQAEPANGEALSITAENVVSSIHAEGSARIIIRQISYPQLSKVEEERKLQTAELEVLQKAIADKYSELNRLVDTPALAIGNPYLFLQPFGYTDRARFFGRDHEIAELSQRLTHSAITFLSGNGGTGKTSLLKAGLIAALLKQQHLPLMVSVNSEALEASVKKELLPNLDAMQFLKAMSLAEFVRVVASALPDGKVLFVSLQRRRPGGAGIRVPA